MKETIFFNLQDIIVLIETADALFNQLNTVEQNRKPYIKDNLSSNWNLVEETNQKKEISVDRIEGI